MTELGCQPGLWVSRAHAFQFHSVAFHHEHKAHVPVGGMHSICRVGSTLLPSMVEVANRSFQGQLLRVHVVTGFLLSTEEEVMIEFPSQLGNRHKRDMAAHYNMRYNKIKQRNDRCDLRLEGKREILRKNAHGRLL